eukprot:776396-Lingulodinium_polyedra.AAC.1
MVRAPELGELLERAISKITARVISRAVVACRRHTGPPKAEFGWIRHRGRPRWLRAPGPGVR